MELHFLAVNTQIYKFKRNEMKPQQSLKRGREKIDVGFESAQD
jgi:hypothetical protein